MVTVLVVDDEIDICSLICNTLKEAKYKAISRRSTAHLEDWILEKTPSLILLDVWFGEQTSSGLVALDRIRKRWPYLPVIIMSGHGNLEMAIEAMRRGANDFLEKPFSGECLLIKIERALENAKLRTEHGELKRRLGQEEELIGRSEAFKSVLKTIQSVAPTESRVLICGDVGTGKERIAWEIHKESKRAQGPFCVVGCASLGDNLENALVDQGWFRKAQSGTLVLDEITDLSLIAQRQLFRILMDISQRRFSSHSALDVRIVSTSRNSLKEWVKTGQFREELFYRLGITLINLPSIQERAEDIPLFLEYFMKKASITMVRSPRKWEENALMALYNYHWPGNVREIQSVVERLLLIGGEEPIAVAMLPQEMQSPFIPLNSNLESSVLSLSMREAREGFMKQYLTAQMVRFQGNISKTADFVGMDRSTLHRWLKSKTDG